MRSDFADSGSAPPKMSKDGVAGGLGIAAWEGVHHQILALQAGKTINRPNFHSILGEIVRRVSHTVGISPGNSFYADHLAPTIADEYFMSAQHAS